jgi:hypothetical protein
LKIFSGVRCLLPLGFANYPATILLAVKRMPTRTDNHLIFPKEKWLEMVARREVHENHSRPKRKADKAQSLVTFDQGSSCFPAWIQVKPIYSRGKTNNKW